MKTKKKSANNSASKTKVKESESGETTMDRSQLKAIATILKAAGSDIKVMKSDDDVTLRRKVGEAIVDLPPLEISKKLDALDPVKMTNVLKVDCLGVFIDINDVSCFRCVDVGQCVSAFVKNLRDGFSHLDSAVVVVDAAKPPSKTDPKTGDPIVEYDAKRAVFIRDVKNPNPKGDDLHDMIQRVLTTLPETLGQLRAIVEQEFDLDGDSDFMEFVTAMRDPKEGVIKLIEDLDDDDRSALKEAGYKI